jgi:hypothetical protein
MDAFHKEQMKWMNYLDNPKIQTVNTSGVYFIENLESLSSNVKALKILKSNLSDGSEDSYYIEFRQLKGFDAELPLFDTDGNSLVSYVKHFLGDYSNLVSYLTRGVLIHVGNNIDTDSSMLLDMNPNTSDWNDAALVPGRWFADAKAAEGGVKIQTISINSTGALVYIGFGTNTTGVGGIVSSAPSSLRPTPLLFVITLILALS